MRRRSLSTVQFNQFCTCTVPGQWACVLFKRTQCSAFFCVLLQNNVAFFAFFYVLCKRILRSLHSFTFLRKERKRTMRSEWKRLRCPTLSCTDQPICWWTNMYEQMPKQIPCPQINLAGTDQPSASAVDQSAFCTSIYSSTWQLTSPDPHRTPSGAAQLLATAHARDPLKIISPSGLWIQECKFVN